MPNLPPGFAPHHLGPPPRRGPGPTVQSAPPPPGQGVLQVTKTAPSAPMNPQPFMPPYGQFMENQATMPMSLSRTGANAPSVLPPQQSMTPGFSPVTSEVPTFNRQQPSFMMNSLPQTTNYVTAPHNAAPVGPNFASVSPEVEFQKQPSFPNMYVSNNNTFQQQNGAPHWQEGDNTRMFSHNTTTVHSSEIGIYSSSSNGLASKSTNGQPKKRVGFAPSHEDITLKDSEYGEGENVLEEETSSIRYEADRIAQRLMQTEQELDRLKKQGDLIGESLRKQKLMDVDSLQDYYTGRTPLNNADAKQELHQPSNLFKEDASPTSGGNKAAMPFQPGSNNTWSEPKPNEIEGSINRMNEELKKSVISDAECESLGLPKGTMWFDGSAAQMDMIQKQLAESQAQSGDRSPSKSNSATMLSISRQEAVPHFHQMNLSPENCSENDLQMTYKRLAPPLHPNVQGSADKLQHLTDSLKICEGYLELQKQGSKDPDQKVIYAKVDAMTYFDQIFFAQAKHANIKVNLGVSLEDLLQGHSAVFEFERKAHDIHGEALQERCQLQVDVVPGMRHGTTFTFPCEGDDAPGYIPGDVIVVLALEQAENLVCVGDDVETEITIPLVDALFGDDLGTVNSLTNEPLAIRLREPRVIQPETRFRIVGEGLPRQENPSERGDLIIKIHVSIPNPPMQEEERNALANLLQNDGTNTQKRHSYQGARPVELLAA